MTKHTSPYPRYRGAFDPLPLYYHNFTVTQKRKSMSDVVTSGNLPRLCPGDYIGEGMWDIVTPRFEKEAKKRLIVNPMTKKFGWVDSSLATCSGSTSTAFTGNLSAQPSGFIYTGTYQYHDFCPNYFSSNFQFPSRPSPAVFQAEAINEAFAGAHQRDVMGIVDLMEMDKTLDMLRTQMGRLESVANGSAWRSLRKGKLGHKKKNKHVQFYKPRTPHGVLADSAGLWLETQYGILPLMQSIEGLVKALGSVSEKAHIQTYRGKSKAQDNYQRVNTVRPQWTGLLYFDDTYTVSIDQTINARAGVISRYSPSLRARLGMETRDLVSAGYELIKFSFLVDWWLDIGTYLEAVTPVEGFTTEASWITTYVEEVVTLSFTRASVSGNIYSDGSWYGSSTALSTSVTHGTRETIRTPRAMPRIPKINSTFKSVRHAISAAALLVSSKKLQKIVRF